ncbi:MAG TPA: SURF1 family protein [Allosphingosinicella sp.]
MDTVGPDRTLTGRVLMTGLLAAGLLFLALGLWQLERRTEKLALIAAVEKRLHQPPSDAPGPRDWGRVSRDDVYRSVRVRGLFLHDRETLVQAATRLGPGYWVLTPLRTDGGWTLLVNRGFVPPEHRGRPGRRPGEPKGPVTVAGLLRASEPGGALLRSNDPARDRWYSRDVEAIGRARGLDTLAPYFIDARTGSSAARQPVAALTTVSFSNNHLQYALTWFALAILAAFGALRVRRDGRGSP